MPTIPTFSGSSLPGWCRVLGVVTCLLHPSLACAETVLYDSALGTLPGRQGWLYLTDPLFLTDAVHEFTNGAARINSMPDREEKAGYFSNLHPGVPVLDREQGYTIRFSVRIDTESHVSMHRAGFSIIVIGNDLKGIELGIWTNRVWAQNEVPLFTQGESASLETTGDMISYRLAILGSQYWLSANGTDVLTGVLRDYTAWDSGDSPLDPYEIPDFIFLGDDTSSASADFQLAYISASVWPDPPHIVSIEPAGGDLVISLDAMQESTSYSLQSCTDLSSGNWSNAVNWVATGTQTNWSIAPFGAPAEFFRVLARP